MTATKDASEEPSDSQTKKMDAQDQEDTEKLERRRKMKNQYKKRKR